MGWSINPHSPAFLINKRINQLRRSLPKVIGLAGELAKLAYYLAL